MFYLDLDEINVVSGRIRQISRNRFNFYEFRDSDHLEFSKKNNVKENILHYVRSQGVDVQIGRVMLLTNLRTLGYIFNPISLYYCFDGQNNPVCVVTEVSNTFREMKPYFLGRETWVGSAFKTTQKKYFYISPYIDLDAVLDFNIKIPGDKLEIHVDDQKDGKKFLLSTMTGERKELNGRNLLKFSFRFPLVTLKVILLIHCHALLLYLKKLPHLKKQDNPELQRGVYREWKKT